MSLEVMLDLETLGTGNNAVILSIGAVKFDLKEQGTAGAPFEVFIDPKTCTDAGLELDANTVLWWMHPDRAAAREVFVGKQLTPLQQALFMFTSWMGGDRPVWGNGATFDNVILRNAFKAAFVPCPWHFRNDRCFRTMSNILPQQEWERVGTHHSAVDDAATQALYLQRIYQGAKL